jgi:phosphonate transport system permease protein
MTLEEHRQKYPEVWKRFTPRETLIRYTWYTGIVFIAVWSLSNLDITWVYFLDAHEQAGDLFVRMVPPYWEFFAEVVDPLVETVHIATLGTVATFFIALPIAFLSARNTTPNAVTWFIGRFILVASRSVNTVVWGLLFVAIFGSRLQVLLVGVLPQVLPVIFGTIVYRWDINIRESTVLGFVGAGGIGIMLYSSINLFAWDEVAVILTAIFGVVLVSEFVSATVRKRIT